MRCEYSNPQRVSPSGRLGRAVRFLATSVYVPALFVAALLAPYVPGGSWEAFVWLSSGLLVPWVWCSVRLSWTGVHLSNDELVARSWFTTKRYPKSDILRCRHDAYTGLMFLAGWTVVDGVLQSGHLIIETHSGVIPLSGTVTSRRISRLQSERINRWLGVPTGDGDGPRRRARRREALHRMSHDDDLASEVASQPRHAEGMAG